MLDKQRMLVSWLAKNTLKKHNKFLLSDLVLSEIKFEIGTHHLVSPNKIKKYSQQFNLESSFSYLCELDMAR